MRKALIVATVSGFVPQFEMNNVKILQGLGYEVHYASNFKNPHYGRDNRRLEGTGIFCHQVDFVRSPFHVIQNIKAYRQLSRLMGEVPFALVHCHTPVGGALGRLAAEKVRRENGKQGSRGAYRQGGNMHAEPARVIYTAHGFHFYKGAPLTNWLLYYPAERMLARITDTLVTINEEDYRRAQKFHLRASRKAGRQLWKVNGAGVDFDAYHNIRADRATKLCELGLKENSFVFLSVGELSRRKNHKAAINAFLSIRRKQKSLGGKKNLGMARTWHYLIAGEGKERKHLEELIHKNNLEGKISLLGYREDVKELLGIADCFVFPSRQEGMPVALLEAAMAGVPLVASAIRGNQEAVGARGYLYRNQKGLEESLKKVCHRKETRERDGAAQPLYRFSKEKVMGAMERIYRYGG